MWRVGNLQPLFEPILWFTKPYPIGGTLADSIIDNALGAFNLDAFENRFRSRANIIRVSRTRDDVGLHPTQKPLALMEALIELTTVKDQVVLDPFCGSGTTLLAAERLSRRHIGIEIDPKYCETSETRLKEYRELANRRLFPVFG